MQPVEKYMLAVSIVWVLFTLFAVAMLLPPLTRRLHEWEVRRKPASRMPTYPQRAVFLLLTLLMTAVSISTTFDRDLRSTIGISIGVAWRLMMILTALYFAVGLLKKHHKNGKQPDA